MMAVVSPLESHSVTPVPQLPPSVESDVRHEPLNLPTPEKPDSMSLIPELATPADPESIPINPPNGTPPPAIGERQEDVQMAEEGVLEHSPMQLEEIAPVNGFNGHAMEVRSEASPPPESQTGASTPPTAGLQTQSTLGEDDLPPPAKRAKLSESDLNGDSFTSLPAASLPSPPDTRATTTTSPPLTQAQHRFCLSTIRTLKKLKDSQPFLRPVDPIALNIPHYSTIITRPMDLGSVERKLLSSNPSKPDPNLSNPRYRSKDEFIADVKLIFTNCIKFNGDDHVISQMASRVQAVFEKQIKQMPAKEEPKPVALPKHQTPAPPPPPPKKAPTPIPVSLPPPAVKKNGPPQRRPSTSVPTIRRSESDQRGRPKREIHPPASKDLPYADVPRKARRMKSKKDDGTNDQLRFCYKILGDLNRKTLYDVASPFYEPVDYVKLELPSYPKIVKKPMDLSTMRKKLDAGEYPSAQKFHDDFKLMIRNCFTFNPEGTLVNQAGVELQKVFDDKWRALPPLREVSDDDDEEGEEEDSEDEQAKAVALMETQIEVLKGNLAAMKKKPKEKKKEKKKEKGGASSSALKSNPSKPYQPGGKTSSKKGKKAGDDSLSFEQKKDLSETIATLDGPKLERVIQIIHEGVPEIRDSTEEIELDIDSLPTAVLMKLYNFVLRPLRNTPKRSRGVGGGTGGLKRKSMDEDVEAERIRQLEERIALFNGDTPAAGHAIRAAADSGNSSDDSSDDSSGSESE